MNDVELINALVNSGTSVIFLWLYWTERKRSKELSDERIAILEKCIERLEKTEDKHHKRPTLSGDVAASD